MSRVSQRGQARRDDISTPRKKWLAALAVIFVACLTPTLRGQSIDEFDIPTANSMPMAIAAGPDGNLWFVELLGGRIGRITPAGVITEFTIPTADSLPIGITSGPDGNVWFTELTPNKIGRITVDGVVTEFQVSSGSGPNAITAGPDGNLWFTESSNKIGRLTTDGALTEFPILINNCFPQSITVGPDGNLWFVESSQLPGENPNFIVSITPAGVMTPFEVPVAADQFTRGIGSGAGNFLWFTETGTNVIGRMNLFGVFARFSLAAFSGPSQIAPGPDGSMWFTERNGDRVGRITSAGEITEVAIPSANAAPEGIVTGPDGNLWVTLSSANKIARIGPALLPAIAVPLLSGPAYIALGLVFASLGSWLIGRR